MTPSSKSWRFWVVKISGNGYRYETRDILTGEIVAEITIETQLIV